MYFSADLRVKKIKNKPQRWRCAVAEVEGFNQNSEVLPAFYKRHF